MGRGEKRAYQVFEEVKVALHPQKYLIEYFDSKLERSIYSALTTGGGGAGYKAIQIAKAMMTEYTEQGVGKGKIHQLLIDIEPVVAAREQIGMSSEGFTAQTIRDERRKLRKPRRRRGHKKR